MTYEESKGDLFSLPKYYALAQCIPFDFENPKSQTMGIAKLFMEKFPSMKGYCLACKLEMNLTYPTCIPYNIKSKEQQTVFNLVTKECYWHKPTYETITKTINLMARYCKKYDVKYLAMPKIGSGLDKLSWAKVGNIIKEEFKDIDINIVVKYM